MIYDRQVNTGAPWFYGVLGTGCGALPRDAEATLMSAARVGTPGSRERGRAIDRAYETTSRLHPTLFKD